jgi:hypothetical protein
MHSSSLSPIHVEHYEGQLIQLFKAKFKKKLSKQEIQEFSPKLSQDLQLELH